MLLHQAPRPTATHVRILAASWLGWLSVFATLIAFFQLSLLYRHDLRLDDRGVSAVKSVALAATGAGGLLIGLLADRLGRRSGMMISILVYAAGVLAAASARSGRAMVAAAALAVPFLPRFLPESDLWRAHRAVARGGERRVSLEDLFAPGVRRPFALAFVLTLFNMANYWLTFSWLPEYLGREWRLAIQKTGAWTLVFVAGSLAGYL